MNEMQVVGSDELAVWWCGPHAQTWVADVLVPALRGAGCPVEQFSVVEGVDSVVVSTGPSGAGLDGIPDVRDPAPAVERTDYRRHASGGDAARTTPYLFVVRVQTLDEWTQPLREWLHGEHFTRQVRTTGISWGHGYEPVSGPGHFFNLWGLEDPGIPGTEEYSKVRASEWYTRVTPAFATAQVSRSVLRRARDRSPGANSVAG